MAFLCFGLHISAAAKGSWVPSLMFFVDLTTFLAFSFYVLVENCPVFQFFPPFFSNYEGGPMST